MYSYMYLDLTEISLPKGNNSKSRIPCHVILSFSLSLTRTHIHTHVQLSLELWVVSAVGVEASVSIVTDDEDDNEGLMAREDDASDDEGGGGGGNVDGGGNAVNVSESPNVDSFVLALLCATF